jgi:hypothetical protein
MGDTYELECSSRMKCFINKRLLYNIIESICDGVKCHQKHCSFKLKVSHNGLHAEQKYIEIIYFDQVRNTQH